MKKRTFSLKLICLTTLIVAVLLAACGGTAETPPTSTPQPETLPRIPNEGRAVYIVSPEDSAVFAYGESFQVEIEMENFELDVEGSHWHVYVDGNSWAMILGKDTKQVLRSLEPGEHEISVYIANGAHEEYEDGDAIAITVTE